MSRTHTESHLPMPTRHILLHAHQELAFIGRGLRLMGSETQAFSQRPSHCGYCTSTHKHAYARTQAHTRSCVLLLQFWDLS
eukprot:120666-Amphidinium_carterae.1